MTKHPSVRERALDASGHDSGSALLSIAREKLPLTKFTGNCSIRHDHESSMVCVALRSAHPSGRI